MNDALSLDICSTCLILNRTTFLDSVNHFVVHTQAFSRLWKTSFYFFAGSSYDSCYIRFGFENLFLVSCLFFHCFSFSLWVLGGLFEFASFQGFDFLQRVLCGSRSDTLKKTRHFKQRFLISRRSVFMSDRLIFIACLPESSIFLKYWELSKKKKFLPFRVRLFQKRRFPSQGSLSAALRRFRTSPAICPRPCLFLERGTGPAFSQTGVEIVPLKT